MVSSDFRNLLLRYIPEERLEALEAKGNVEEDSFDGVRYVRLRTSVRNLPRGTVLFEDGTVVLGFPHIKRIVQLENGVRRIFKGRPFYVEEKVDGYNVRVVKVEGRILALTRGGFVCPFTTERILDFVNEDFFRDYPGLILVGEMAGPESPYMVEWPPYVKEDIQFFLFDVQEKGTGKSIPVEERYKLAEEYGIPQVRRFGLYDRSKIEELREVIEELNREGLEGVILKTPDMKRIAKYVTPYANINDIRIGSRIFFDLPGGYFMGRISRVAFYLAELRGENFDDYARALGEALLRPLVESIEKVAQGGEVAETFRVRVKNVSTAHRLVEHLERLGLEIRIENIERVGGHWRVTFTRLYPRTTEEIWELWNGLPFVD